MNAADSEVFRYIKETPYGFCLMIKSTVLWHNYLEYIYKIHKMYFRRQPFSVACIISYLRLKELELANIISIIEGIRYGLSEERIQKFVAGITL